LEPTLEAQAFTRIVELEARVAALLAALEQRDKDLGSAIKAMHDAEGEVIRLGVVHEKSRWAYDIRISRLLAALEAFRTLRSDVFENPAAFYDAMLRFELEVVDPALAATKEGTEQDARDREVMRRDFEEGIYQGEGLPPRERDGRFQARPELDDDGHPFELGFAEDSTFDQGEGT
jgi:hypothetical protein